MSTPTPEQRAQMQANGEVNPDRDALKHAFQLISFEYPNSSDDPLGFDDIQDGIDEDTQHLDYLHSILNRRPKVQIGDVIWTMGMQVKVESFQRDGTIRCVILDHGEDTFFAHSQFVALEQAS